MIKQLLNEIEAAKVSLQEWQRKEREAAQQVLLGRGYLQGLGRALDLVRENNEAAGLNSAPAALDTNCDVETQ